MIAVHLYGQCADLDALAALCVRHGLALVEDACQAHGARIGERPVGSVGHAAAFSFYATKNVAIGEGGMVVAEATVRLDVLTPPGAVEVVVSLRQEGIAWWDESAVTISTPSAPSASGVNRPRTSAAD